MHSCEPLPAAPAQGPTLLQQLGRLIIRARSTSPAARPARDPRDRLLQAKLRAANPSTSAQVTQPKPEPDPHPGVEAQLESHVQALWTDQVPLCIEVLLAPECAECSSALGRAGVGAGAGAGEGRPHPPQGLLLERWTMRARVGKSHEKPAFITSQWLLNAVRSQLHFSQLSAWLARLTTRPQFNHDKCNYKKLESNCDETDPANEDRQLNVVYCIKIPGEHQLAEFTKPPTDHSFPITDIGNNIYLNVNLESLPRIDAIPTVKCTCQKRRASKEVPVNLHEELVGKLNDLTLNSQKYEINSINSINSLGHSSRRLSIVTNAGNDYPFKQDENAKKDKILDDRMHTNCSENGKHKCSCDEESDRSSNNFNNEPKKLDERRLKEIAKYKRRLRKESKLKKLCDSTSSEGDGLKKEPHTSIPILQASRFDRFRAIGCYRNQTYLTLPASRIECKSPFIDSVSIPPTEFKKTVSIATQTDDILCSCGVKVNLKCENCRMVRSDATYDLASLNNENGGRRKREEENSSSKKLKCDNLSSNTQCDSVSLVDDSFSNSDLIKRPKLRRFFPIMDRIEKVLTDRCNRDAEKDIEQLHLKTDDSVFVAPKPEPKRHKTFSISEDYVTLEKCDYGTFDRCDMDSPQELTGFNYPDLKTVVNDETPNRYHDLNGHSSNLNQNLYNLNQTTTNLNEISPEFHQNVHDWNQYSTNLNHNAANLNQNAANLNQNASNLNHNVANLNNHAVNLNNHAVNLNNYAVNLNHNAVNFNQNASNLNHYSTNLSNNAANLNQQQNQPENVDHKNLDHQVPSPSEMDRFRWRFDSAASMVFHTKTGLPLTSSPAPLRRGNNCFDFDDSINGISGIKSALFHPISPSTPPVPSPPAPRARTPPSPSPVPRTKATHKLNLGPSTGLLGSFEESALKGRLEPVATVAGFVAELGASGAFCPPHRRLPVTVFFYAPGGTNAPYMGHINLGPNGYRVARSGTIQVSLFNPHGTLVKMFVVLYDLTCMPPMARTFLRQRTLYMPAGADAPSPHELHKWLRYLIHLRFMTSKSGKLYLHTDIRIIVSRKADLDTATAHSALIRPIPTNHSAPPTKSTNQNEDKISTNGELKNLTNGSTASSNILTNGSAGSSGLANNRPNRVFGGCGEFEEKKMREIGYENQNGVSYELRSFTYAPENPRYSPR